jgi:hypothetical protein
LRARGPLLVTGCRGLLPLAPTPLLRLSWAVAGGGVLVAKDFCANGGVAKRRRPLSVGKKARPMGARLGSRVKKQGQLACCCYWPGLLGGGARCARNSSFWMQMVMWCKSRRPLRSAKKRDQWVRTPCSNPLAPTPLLNPLLAAPQRQKEAGLLQGGALCGPSLSTWVPLSHTAAPRTHARLVLTLEKVPMSSPLFLIKGHRHMGIHTVPLNTHPPT